MTVYLLYKKVGRQPAELVRVYKKGSRQAVFNVLAEAAEKAGNALIPGYKPLVKPCSGDKIVAEVMEPGTPAIHWWYESHDAE